MKTAHSIESEMYFVYLYLNIYTTFSTEQAQESV